jgi:leader peptidase (prepilin peptidase) / N-methyltransferase
VFGLGAIVASFIGVVAARLNTGQSFLSGRSQCDMCGQTLPALALVPILSFLFQRGRAQCCNTRLPVTAVLTELVLGVLFVTAYMTIGMSFGLAVLFIALALLLALVLYDLEHQILPPLLLGLFVAVSAIARFFLGNSMSEFIFSFVVAIGLGMFILLIHALSQGRAMGLSDAPLTFGLALLTGSAAISGFVFSFWIGAVVGIVILARRPHGSRMGVEVPFAPFLAAGFLLAYFTQWNPFTTVAVLLS